MDASGPMEWRAFLSVQCENSSSTLNRGIGRTIAKKLSGKRLGNQWQFATVNRTRNRKKALRPSLRSRKRPIDGHLAGLLTYASMNLKRLPGSSHPFTPTSGAKWGPSQWHVAQVLSAYSCGAVADSHRASHYQTEENYMRTAGKVKRFGKCVIW